MNAGKNDPVAHGSFTLERVFPQKPATVFGAFATAEGKARWFSGGADWKPLVREMDFRVGGHERAKGQWANGTVTDFLAHYHDIVQDRRIVYSYHMLINEEPISASLATLEFRAEGSGTRLVMTEQGAFYNGYVDGGSRERGTKQLLEQVAASLEG